MGNLSPPSMDGTNSEIASLSARIMLATIIVVFLMVVILFFAHLYAKWYWSTSEDPTIVAWRRRTARQQGTPAAVAQRRGLEVSDLESLPVEVYNPKDFKEVLECAVCLSEVSEGEKVRLLPKCNHGFHLECIDMWFQSHSTCPLCRDPVVSSENLSDNPNAELHNEVGVSGISSESDSDSDDDNSSYHSVAHSIEAPSFPTNVLFWGNETQVSSLGHPSEEVSKQATDNAASSASSSSTSTNGVGKRDELVIEIPRELCGDCLSSPTSDEAKTPVVSRLRSLRRLLSRGKRVVPSPHASSSVDIEQV